MENGRKEREEEKRAHLGPSRDARINNNGDVYLHTLTVIDLYKLCGILTRVTIDGDISCRVADRQT